MVDPTKRGLLVDNIQVAASVEEALAHLSTHRGQAQVIAGGTVLMPAIESGASAATYLVDISQVCTMRRIALTNGHLVIGGAVTFAALIESPLIRSHAPMLYEAAFAVGGEDVRALATLVGRMVAAEGSAESSVALVALDAEAEIANLTGSQWLPVESLFVRSGVSRVDSTSEIVTAVRVPLLTEGQGAALGWMAHPEPSAPAPIVMALEVSLAPERDTIAWASIALGTPMGIPAHVVAAEQALQGAAVDDPKTRERFTRLVGAAGADAMRIDETERETVRQALAPLVQGCYDQALRDALARPAASNGHVDG